MSGVYVYQVDRTPPHKCEMPGRYSDPKPVGGDIWLCECGKLYQARSDWSEYAHPGDVYWRKRRLPLWGKLRRDVEKARE